VLDHSLVVYMNKGLFTYLYQPVCYFVAMELLMYSMLFQASCVYDEYRYVMLCEGTEVEAYWEPNKLVYVSAM